MELRRTLLLLMALVGAAWAFWAWRAPAPGVEYTSLTAESMATLVSVTLPADRQAQAHAKAVFEVFEGVDARMSEWKDSSPLSAVNREAGGKAVRVPGELRGVIRRGMEIGDQTGGAFDITWAAFWGLWNFKAAEPSVPPDAEIERRLPLVDYRLIEVDDRAGTVRLPRAGMKIGLGGIAKGYALDRAAEALRKRGAHSFLISGGGQVMAVGRKGDRPWRVGIRDPRGGRDDYFAYLALSDASASTSGDYEHFFIQDGVRYHHILDPRTGRPSTGLRSATVISPDATLADALSTAFMVMDREAALSLTEKLEQVEAVLVDDRGQVWTSSGLKDRLETVHAPAP